MRGGERCPELVPGMAGGIARADSGKWAFNIDFPTPPTMQSALSMGRGERGLDCASLAAYQRTSLEGTQSVQSIGFGSIRFKIYRCPFIAS